MIDLEAIRSNVRTAVESTFTFGMWHDYPSGYSLAVDGVVEAVMLAIQPITECDCGRPRSLGTCTGHCDNDE